MFLCSVSILLILDVDSEVNWRYAPIIQEGSFNPSYSGCWFGRHLSLPAPPPRLPVSILLILDVDSEASGSEGDKIFQTLFQSFLFWMLIRKTIESLTYSERMPCFNPSYSGCWFGSYVTIRFAEWWKEVSILLILDVDSEGVAKLAARYWSIRFNPSYSGCWFGSRARQRTKKEDMAFQSFLFWMLIRKDLVGAKAGWETLGFNPSYSGCWFGSKPVLMYPMAVNKFQSFLFWMLIRKWVCRWTNRIHTRVSILLILDVDSEVGRVYSAKFVAGLSFNPSYSGCWFGRTE